MMKKAGIETIYPLSPTQTGLLYHSMSDPMSGAYVQQLCCVIHGSLTLDVFKQSWDHVVEQNAVLRTMITSRKDGEPLQVVNKYVETPWSVKDWSYLPSEKQEKKISNYLKTDRERGFDLSKAPLMRILLVQTDKDTYQLIWTLHHLILDGWSVALVLKDVFLNYHLLIENNNTKPVPRRPYHDYIHWLKGRDFSASEKRWKQRLAGFIKPSRFPCDKPPQNKEEERFKELETKLLQATTEQLLKTARQLHITSNTLTQAAWALLVSHFSGLEDIVYGVTVSGRPAMMKGINGMVGFFIDTVPMRVQIPYEERLDKWLQGLHSSQAETYQLEYCPLANIQTCSELPKGMSLFDSILVFEDYPGYDGWQAQCESLSIESVRFYGQTDYPITVIIEPGSQLLLRIMYDYQLFSKEMMNRLLDGFTHVLQQFAEDPYKKLSEYSPLSPERKQKIVFDWNQTEKNYQRNSSIHKVFEDRVENNPDGLAIVYGDTCLTYAQCNKRANQLAHFLISLGVESEGKIGICLEPSVDYIVALLGILKAGAVYVPLDPDYPSDRLAWVMEDAEITVLLTQESLMDQLPTYWGMLFSIDGDRSQLDNQECSNPSIPCSSDNLAYLIYTSGSTGNPKGVAITHRSVLSLVCNTDYVDIGASDTIAQYSNMAFDAVTFEIWGALLNGAKLVGVNKDTGLNPKRFIRKIHNHHINILFITTALFNQLTAETPEIFASLKYLLFGGEAVDPRAVRRIVKDNRPQHILHVYGPTENTTFTTWFPIEDVQNDATTIPIGRPISNTKTFILNERLDPVPVGVIGEIYIGGDGLARHYHNQPELTIEKFIPDPFGKEGDRLYKTGDLAHFLPSGDIVFIGRKDDQVKHHGFRIELQEIEKALLQHENVKGLSVQLKEDVLGDKRLVAYLVIKENQQSFQSNGLRDFLQTKLPKYMIPEFFIALDTLPVNNNGKLDKEKLPAPGEIKPVTTQYFPPGTELEITISDIWKEVLNLEQIGLDDNFFELGGHSLHMVKVANRLQKTLACDISVTKMFKYPNIRTLSESLNKKGADKEVNSFERVKSRSELQRESLKKYKQRSNRQ